MQYLVTWQNRPTHSVNLDTIDAPDIDAAWDAALHAAAATDSPCDVIVIGGRDGQTLRMVFDVDFEQWMEDRSVR